MSLKVAEFLALKLRRESASLESDVMLQLPLAYIIPLPVIRAIIAWHNSGHNF